MRDRFKFRVWDDTHKEYLPLSDCKLDARSGRLVKQSLFLENRYIIEQCTGLTDKNGKLIYEGDVALFDNGTCEIKGATICFTGSGFCAKWDGGHTTPLHAINDIIEIIGNIHEMEAER